MSGSGGPWSDRQHGPCSPDKPLGCTAQLAPPVVGADLRDRDGAIAALSVIADRRIALMLGPERAQNRPTWHRGRTPLLRVAGMRWAVNRCLGRGVVAVDDPSFLGFRLAPLVRSLCFCRLSCAGRVLGLLVVVQHSHRVRRACNQIPAPLVGEFSNTNFGRLGQRARRANGTILTVPRDIGDGPPGDRYGPLGVSV